MNKFKKYLGCLIILFCFIIGALAIYFLALPAYEKYNKSKEDISSLDSKLAELKRQEAQVRDNLDKLNKASLNIKKKIYTAKYSETGEGSSDALFFTLYNDTLEMIHKNSVKIHSIKYTYNPEDDIFVKNRQDAYFVCELNMDLIASYSKFASLFEDILSYSYYIKIKSAEITPYEKDKTILRMNLVLVLYAKTTPEEPLEEE